MTPREVIDKYYEYANAGDWDAWCDLFTEGMVMDEQIAGHIEGRETLRRMMRGMRTTYPKFQNVPQHILTSGDEGAVVSHISAASAAGVPIEAGVMNYFRFEGGQIAYMANFHDTRPFEPDPWGGNSGPGTHGEPTATGEEEFRDDRNGAVGRRDHGVRPRMVR